VLTGGEHGKRVSCPARRRMVQARSD